MRRLLALCTIRPRAFFAALAAALVLFQGAAAQVAPAAGVQPTPASTRNPAVAGTQPGAMYETPGESATVEPRRIAAAIVANAFPTPHLVVQVGASTGALLETFMEGLPTAHGVWIEAITSEHNLNSTKARLGKFGDRVDYQFSCARRDLSSGCVLPKGTDVILMDWLSIQQNIDGMARIYKAGADSLPSGGWIVNLDHVTFSDSTFEPLMHMAAKDFRPGQEGPPIHYPQFKVPTADEQLAALRAAGFDAQVVWQSFTTVLIMGRKK